jgi:hypothetical protein
VKPVLLTLIVTLFPLTAVTSRPVSTATLL